MCRECHCSIQTETIAIQVVVKDQVYKSRICTRQGNKQNTDKREVCCFLDRGDATSKEATDELTTIRNVTCSIPHQGTELDNDQDNRDDDVFQQNGENQGQHQQ